jgi:hypothetical protein
VELRFFGSLSVQEAVVELWTTDPALAAVAKELGISYE